MVIFSTVVGIPPATNLLKSVKVSIAAASKKGQLSIEDEDSCDPWRCFGHFSEREIENATPLLDTSNIAFYVDDTLRNVSSAPAALLWIHGDHWDKAVSLLAPFLKPN